jgi:hypothetical protein
MGSDSTTFDEMRFDTRSGGDLAAPVLDVSEDSDEFGFDYTLCDNVDSLDSGILSYECGACDDRGVAYNLYSSLDHLARPSLAASPDIADLFGAAYDDDNFVFCYGNVSELVDSELQNLNVSYISNLCTDRGVPRDLDTAFSCTSLVQTLESDFNCDKRRRLSSEGPNGPAASMDTHVNNLIPDVLNVISTNALLTWRFADIPTCDVQMCLASDFSQPCRLSRADVSCNWRTSQPLHKSDGTGLTFQPTRPSVQRRGDARRLTDDINILISKRPRRDTG